MERNVIKYVCEFFKELTELHGFNMETELKGQELYMVKFSSGSFVIKIEKYFREFNYKTV